MKKKSTSNITKPQHALLPPSTPFRNKRIPIACIVLPIGTFCLALSYHALNYISDGYAKPVLVLTAVLVLMMQYLVYDYAPNKNNLKEAISDLKLKIPLQLVFCISVFFRGVTLASKSFWGTSIENVDSSGNIIVWNLILILIGGFALSSAVCSRYIGPCAIATCSWTPLYVQTYKPNESVFQKFCNTIIYLLPTWDEQNKQSEFDRKRQAFFQKHPHNLFQEPLPQPRKLFDGVTTSGLTGANNAESSNYDKRISKIATLEIPNKQHYWIPKKSASAPLQPTILSTFAYTIAGTVYGYCMTDLMYMYPHNDANYDSSSSYSYSNNTTARKWCILSAAISSAWFLFTGTYRLELPLQNLYVGQRHKMTFIQKSVQEAVQQLFTMLLVFQVLIACFLSTDLMDELASSSSSSIASTIQIVWHITSAVMTAFAVSVLTIAQLALSDCIVGFFIVERIKLSSLAKYTHTPLPAVCVLFSLCENRSKWITALDEKVGGNAAAGMLLGGVNPASARLDREQQEIKRNHAVIEQMVSAWMTKKTKKMGDVTTRSTEITNEGEESSFFYDNTCITFSDEVSRAVILEALGGGGEFMWNNNHNHTTETTSIAGEKRHDEEMTELVSKNSLDVCLPVARALAASVGAVGAMLIRSSHASNDAVDGTKQFGASTKSKLVSEQKVVVPLNKNEEEEYVVVRFPSSAIVQAQFSMMAISRMICKTHELKGKYYPVMSLVPAVLESIFQLRLGLISFALAIAKRQGVIKSTVNYDDKVGSVIARVCPEISSLFVACDVAGKSICGTFERGEQNVKLLRASLKCREWVDKL